MTQLIIARKALGPSFAPGGGLEVLPGLLTGLFSPFAVGFRDVAQPHPTLSFCVGPTRPGITPAAPWHQFWGFFLAISSLERGGRDARPGSLSITWIMTKGSLSPPKNEIFPFWEDLWVLTRCLHEPILSPDSLGAASFAPSG